MERTNPLPPSPAESPADLEGAAAEERATRIAEVDRWRAAGVDPYPVRFDRDATVAELLARHGSLPPDSETEHHVRVAGRLVLVRRQGKLVFAQMRDGSGTIQLFVSRSVLGEDAFESFKRLDLGDWVGVEGAVMTTRAGELSIRVERTTLLAKALRPLPDKWHGLADVDTRYRQRYVDLIANDDARRVFAVRTATVRALRSTFHDRGFVEVETPVLQPVAGGATARPFVTHHHALDLDLFLRVAPELYLKRLVVGGYERVFEIGRVFRNEGLSTRHNPEFTMLEAYQAFADYHDMMELTEAVVVAAADAALGGRRVEWGGREVSLEPPFERRTLRDLVGEHAGVDVHPSRPVQELERICDDLGVPRERGWGPGKLVLEVYEKTTEHSIEGPTFVLDYPTEVSPLARTHRDDPALAERFELIVGGRELANAFSELTDPIDQRARLEAQAGMRAAGDEEAHDVDHDYLRALEYGLPPTGGLGIGVDRLVMLLAGVTSIREVVLFPHLRPEAAHATPSEEA